MKKKTILFLVIALLIPYSSLATPLDFHGGVQNEHLYEEYVFINGQPNLFRGTYTVRESSSRNTETLRYTFKLDEVGGDGKLTRNVTFKGDDVEYKAIGQTTNTMEVDRYNETIDLDGDTYSLEDYQFSKSDVLDSRPASDFYEGNIVGRRFYKINKNEGEVTIDMTGGNVGYENFWGRTETQIIDHTISYKRTGGSGGEEDSKDSKWIGTYSYQVSDSLTKELRYSENAASLSTIDGGHVKVTNHSIVSKYTYSLPDARGSKSLNQEMLPKVERLIVPKFRDVNGHWAEDNIKKLYSLNVFDDNSSVFSPDTPMNRMDFTKAVIRASDIRVEDQPRSKRRRRNEPEEVAYFKDTSIKDESYKYVKAGVDKKIIEGISSTKFAPEDSLTRAEAVTILMRSLGYEEKAPNPGYRTSFADDSRIPNWAKDSIYMGQQVGLITGDSNNRVNPNKQLTRAEASTLIINYLKFLEKGLQRDYRDNIIKYN